MKWLLFFLCFAAVANDKEDLNTCAPDTLARCFPNTPFKLIYSSCLPDGQTNYAYAGSSIAQITNAWNKFSTSGPLIPIFSIMEEIPVLEKEIKFGKPYLWVGMRTRTDVGHMAIAVIFTNNVIISHSELSGTNYIRETLDYPTFLKKTYVVYEIPTNIAAKVKW